MAALSSCQYGANCYQKSADHWRLYSHPMLEPVLEPVLEQNCKYGQKCYNQNAQHIQKYYHVPKVIEITYFANPKPPCQYGDKCYRKNINHIEECLHVSNIITKCNTCNSNSIFKVVPDNSTAYWSCTVCSTGQ